VIAERMFGRPATWYEVRRPDDRGGDAAVPLINGEFEVRTWDEDTYLKLGGERRMSRASVTQHFTGGINGEGSVEWLMCYHDDGTASFVGLQYIEGKVDGRDGAFVMEVEGDFDGEEASGAWSVVSRSGVGAMAGLRGDGQFRAPRGPNATYTLEYELD
jgi:hypothetical protein